MSLEWISEAEFAEISIVEIANFKEVFLKKKAVKGSTP